MIWKIALAALFASVGLSANAQVTTAFDGTYAGISREVSKMRNESGNCGARNIGLGPLVIANGVARAPGWEGTVSAGGVLVMRSRAANPS